MNETQRQTDGALVLAREAASDRPLAVFSDMRSFEDAQRVAKALASSDLVPDKYKNNMGNCLVALEIAARTGASVLAVTQNLNVINGRPSWGSSYIIAALNSCGRFSPLRFKLEDRGTKKAPATVWEGPKGNRSQRAITVEIHDKACIAYAVEKASGEVLEGPEVSVAMAVAEGWYTRDGSKWVTMEGLMLRYRAAAFFGRLYAPDILMGMHTRDETEDFIDVTPEVVPAGGASAGSDPVADINRQVTGGEAGGQAHRKSRKRSQDAPAQAAPANDNTPAAPASAPAEGAQVDPPAGSAGGGTDDPLFD